jgi:hypothetical protein
VTAVSPATRESEENLNKILLDLKLNEIKGVYPKETDEMFGVPSLKPTFKMEEITLGKAGILLLLKPTFKTEEIVLGKAGILLLFEM